MGGQHTQNTQQCQHEERLTFRQSHQCGALAEIQGLEADQLLEALTTQTKQVGVSHDRAKPPQFVGVVRFMPT